MSIKLAHPTIALVESYLEKFRHDNRYYSSDEAINKLFVAFPQNREFEDVLLKVTVVNSLYSTQIFAIYKMAQHICNLEIDTQLESGSTAVVDKIAWLKLDHKIRRNYSFATKYCSWHYPNKFPIYDFYVDELVWAYQQANKFAQFKRSDLVDYPRYKLVIENFRSHYGLQQFSFKELDKFLWMYGKDYYTDKIQIKRNDTYQFNLPKNEEGNL